MKKIMVVSLLAIPLMFNNVARATGIPVVDVAGILQMVVDGLARAQEFEQQIKEAKNRLTELKNTADHYKDMVEGHYDFETILNDPLLNEHLALDDWKDIYNDTSNLQSLRDEFDMHSNNPAVQERYDSELQQYSAQKRFYDMSVQRNKNMKSLLNQFNSATNPAAKADLANSIQFENTQLENDAKMMESMTMLMEQKINYEKTRAANEKMEVITGAGMPIDYSAAYGKR